MSIDYKGTPSSYFGSQNADAAQICCSPDLQLVASCLESAILFGRTFCTRPLQLSITSTPIEWKGLSVHLLFSSWWSISGARVHQIGARNWGMRVGRECPKMGDEIMRALEQGDEMGFYLTCAAAELN